MNSQRASPNRRLITTLNLLEEHQGEKTWLGLSDPLESLIRTLLSQNTNDALRDRAYQRLRRRFRSWEEVLVARSEEVEEAIRIAGLSHQKAARMQDILRWVKEEFGQLSLEALSGMDDDRALDLLKSRKGVGVKTAAVVLMAALGRDLCPVDTHVHRISRRLGWVPETAMAERSFELLRPHVPRGKGYSLHMNLLQFGRTICHARKPLCRECFLWDECAWEGKGVKTTTR